MVFNAFDHHSPHTGCRLEMAWATMVVVVVVVVRLRWCDGNHDYAAAVAANLKRSSSLQARADERARARESVCVR